MIIVSLKQTYFLIVPIVCWVLFLKSNHCWVFYFGLIHSGSVQIPHKAALWHKAAQGSIQNCVSTSKLYFQLKTTLLIQNSTCMHNCTSTQNWAFTQNWTSTENYTSTENWTSPKTWLQNKTGFPPENWTTSEKTGLPHKSGPWPKPNFRQKLLF